MKTTLLTMALLMTAAALGLLAAGGQEPAAEQQAPKPPAAAPNDPIVFKVLTGEQTGLKAIMEKWRADELKRQGGKFKDSHEWWPYKINVFDFDNDGALDLLVAHHGPPGCKILRNTIKETGKVAFTDITRDLGVESWDLPIADEDVIIWDFDGDGYLDIGGFSDESQPRSFFNLGAKKLEVIPKHTFHPLDHVNSIGDVNGDGYPDVTGVHFNEATRKGTTYQFVYDPENRTFKKSQRDYVPPAVPIPQSVKDFMDKASKKNPNPRAAYLLRYKTQFDLNGDGIKDTIFMGHISYRNDTATCYLLADKDGKLTDRTEEMGLPHDGTPALVHDLDGDGNLDIVVSCGAGAGVYLGDGKGRFRLVKEGNLRKFLTLTNGHVHSVTAVDFNNDGQMDLVVGLARWPTQQIYQNKGGGVFDLVAQTSKTWTWTPGVDVNGDGLPDIVVGGPGETDVTIYLNQTVTTNRGCDLYPRMAKPNPFAVGAVLEVFRAGELGKSGARPIHTGSAHPDGTPIHVGLGQAKSFDLRATFPGREPKLVELKGVAAAAKVEVNADGKVRELK